MVSLSDVRLQSFTESDCQTEFETRAVLCSSVQPKVDESRTGRGLESNYKCIDLQSTHLSIHPPKQFWWQLQFSSLELDRILSQSLPLSHIVDGELRRPGPSFSKYQCECHISKGLFANYQMMLLSLATLLMVPQTHTFPVQEMVLRRFVQQRDHLHRPAASCRRVLIRCARGTHFHPTFA
ncbi:hypothetical protein SCLCIDRAFT_933176 [Scleroderma citrinum Foug A]|uniref:Uncharacterized protein n=1 Tax=Scleroderma citrinum Foug A TaxID=1036808 RepID=A0A0C2ZG69_9AGAM|nr:hypothetical protein SCLCIDRAFT_933176 [Scleroderma citrinum Foug A]